MFNFYVHWKRLLQNTVKFCKFIQLSEKKKSQKTSTEFLGEIKSIEYVSSINTVKILVLLN